MKEFKNKFTADGRVRPVPGVSQTKVHAVQKLMEAQGAVSTDYGVLLSGDGMTVEQCITRPDQHMEMR